MPFAHVAPWIWFGQCKSTGEPDQLWYAIITPYVPQFVERLKETIWPPAHRRWNPDLKLWMVHRTQDRTLKKLLREFFGVGACDECLAGKPCDVWVGVDQQALNLGQGHLDLNPTPPPPPRQQRRPEEPRRRATRPEEPPPRQPPPPRAARSLRDPLAAAAELLGVTPGAGVDDIRSAFKRAARAAHPDLGGSHEKFLAVREAAEALLRSRGIYGRL
jgi:hypothetical protein